MKAELRVEAETVSDGACLEEFEKAIAQAAGSCGMRVVSIHGGDSLAERIAEAGMIDAAKRGFFDGEGQTPEQNR
ncbi:hypothetical protein [Gimesia chilikensis]|uniref:Uncharacterized protein n=1 Tax=Gimesia chilikensis TaxID=2605989 RepID=A0A517PIK1_9PLAN|nr:hypothetical protein [Gimesia chilikensis]QDT19212.1 hypothetical protein HG66A1_09760 [Gimesia chilikensis]